MTTNLLICLIGTQVPRERGAVTLRQNSGPQRPGDKEFIRVYSIRQTLAQDEGALSQKSLDLKALCTYRHNLLHQRRGQERGDMYGSQIHTPT